MSHRIAGYIIDLIGDLGIHVEVYRSHANETWCELVAFDLSSGESWRIESDDLYTAACELAVLIGCDLE